MLNKTTINQSLFWSQFGLFLHAKAATAFSAS